MYCKKLCTLSTPFAVSDLSAPFWCAINLYQLLHVEIIYCRKRQNRRCQDTSFFSVMLLFYGILFLLIIVPKGEWQEVWERERERTCWESYEPDCNEFSNMHLCPKRPTTPSNLSFAHSLDITLQNVQPITFLTTWRPSCFFTWNKQIKLHGCVQNHSLLTIWWNI